MPEILSKYPTVTPLYEGQNREAKKTTDSVSVGWTNYFIVDLHCNCIYISFLQSANFINNYDSF